ncbi:MAG: calcium/sodium antiporter [Bacteroidales bacterium]|nr:calcium/sodium antiporter [Bacteroidales bacterium]
MQSVSLLFLIIGLCLIVFGADSLVDGASSIARRFRVSEFVIGLTIVGFGTSCPELVVSLTGAIAGNADISVGNVVGSNIFNTLCIIGLTTLVSPIAVSVKNRKVDLPMVICTTLVTIALGLTAGRLNRIEGVILLLLFAVYMVYCFRSQSGDALESGDIRQRKLPVAILFTVAGLAGLIIGGDLFVKSAMDIARKLGVSDKFIAITLLAGGTSLPELATCIAAAVRKKNQLAFGNIIGSNIFNLLLILGSASVITPLSFAALNVVDLSVLIGSTVLLLLFAYTGKKASVNRVEGSALFALFVGYYIYLFLKP